MSNRIQWPFNARLLNSTASQTFFQPELYYELPNDGNHIRLLKIDPGHGDDPITGRMWSCSLADNPQYAAISYTWATGKEVPILVNGYNIKIRLNLFNFLMHLRQWDASLPVWVDAVCIRQDRVDEKNRQVRIMGKIFETARMTWVWLGPGISPGGVSRMFDLFLDRDSKDWRDTLESSAGALIKGGFYDLIYSPYWTRTWIIQEFILSRSIRLFLGDNDISFNHLANGIVRLIPILQDPNFYLTPQTSLNYSWADFSVSRNPRRDNFISILQFRTLHLESRQHELLTADNLISTFFQNSCTDTKDKVYALLSFARPEEPWTQLEINYGTNIFLFYFRVLHLIDRSITIDTAFKWQDALRFDDTALQDFLRKNKQMKSAQGHPLHVKAILQPIGLLRSATQMKPSLTTHIELSNNPTFRHLLRTSFAYNHETSETDSETITTLTCWTPVQEGAAVFRLAGSCLYVAITQEAHGSIRIFATCPAGFKPEHSSRASQWADRHHSHLSGAMTLMNRRRKGIGVDGKDVDEIFVCVEPKLWALICDFGKGFD